MRDLLEEREELLREIKFYTENEKRYEEKYHIESPVALAKIPKLKRRLAEVELAIAERGSAYDQHDHSCRPGGMA